MNSRQRKKEEQNRINESLVYGITLSDIKKKHSDNRFFLCLVRAILIFLAVYGTIAGLVASFELPFNVPLVIISLAVLSLIASFIYYNKITFYVGYILIFLIVIIIAFAFYMYINSGFQAFLNEVISRYETFFSLVSGRVAEEQITDRYLTVTAMIIFVSGIFSIFFNITIAGYMDLPMTFIVSFIPLQFAFYIDIVPPMIYLVMLLCVYISVAVLGRSGRYTLPYRYKEDTPFGRIRKKKYTSHYYHASGNGMMHIMGCSLILSVIVMLIVGSVFSTDFSTRRLSNVVKDTTDKYVKTIVVNGITALFNRYDAKGGLSNGQLGGVRSVNPDYQTDLIGDYVPLNNDDIYLKAYTGVRYERNRFYNTISDNASYANADAIIEADDYIPVNASDNTPYVKMQIENKDADKTYYYQPYVPIYTTAVGSPSKLGIAGSRINFFNTNNIFDGIILDTSLSDDTYETVYLPLMGNVNYGANDSAKAEEYKSLFLEYPDYLESTLSQVADEASLMNEDINSQDSQAVKALTIAEKLKTFYESNFRYTMTPGSTPYNEDVIEHFLTKNRRGFCAHFASSATLLLRYAGVPARYCEGYLLQPSSTINNKKLSDITDGWLSDGTSTTPTGVYEIELSDANAHSWVEIYVEGYGWIPYEMTPPDYGDEASTANLGIFGMFAGLFNPTERLIDDTDGSFARDLGNNSNDITDALGNAIGDASSNWFANFTSSVGYLLLPFLWMLIALIVVIAVWLGSKRLVLELRRRRLIKKGQYGEALLLEYRAALSRWKKKGIVKGDNPSVRDVENVLANYISNNNSIDIDDLSCLMDTIQKAAFSPDDIAEGIYTRCRIILKEL